MPAKAFEAPRGSGHWFVSITYQGEEWCQEVGADKHRAHRIAAIATSAETTAKDFAEIFQAMLEYFTLPPSEQIRRTLRFIPGGQTN